MSQHIIIINGACRCSSSSPQAGRQTDEEPFATQENGSLLENDRHSQPRPMSSLLKERQMITSAAQLWDPCGLDKDHGYLLPPQEPRGCRTFQSERGSSGNSEIIFGEAVWGYL